MLHKYYKVKNNYQQPNSRNECFHLASLNTLLMLRAAVRARARSIRMLHTVAGIRSDVVLDVVFARNDTGVGVQPGALVAAGTLAQCVRVHLVQLLFALAHRKQFARFLSLALQCLLVRPERADRSKRGTDNRGEKRSRKIGK